MIDQENVITSLEQVKDEINPVSGSRKARLRDAVDDAIALLKEQEQRINELEEKLRLLEYGDQDTLQSGMMPAT